MDEHDVRMLREAKVVLDAGFPEAALLQLVRVYADAMGRVAEAEVRLFHFYVHEGLRATGLAGPDLVGSSRAVRDHMLPIVDPLIRYFHYRGMVKSLREDMVLHLTETEFALLTVSRPRSCGWPSSSSTSQVTPR